MIVLGNFLSGMETPLRGGTRDIDSILGNFLSGMETRKTWHLFAEAWDPWKLP